ncbi:hypothetical protein BDV98DRAFT_52640 [Pterulicium gracile]|uniref:Uncharacterized protein n=1 Tax=Pterulicium gracile TaxID=1884261 RepID=A0A5C3QK46_9AGAR|nr:hypothetical protein BDV98DRAFT_52640 [Pterula gracilis]
MRSSEWKTEYTLGCDILLVRTSIAFYWANSCYFLKLSLYPTIFAACALHAIIASLVHATSIVTIGGSSVAISGLATCYVSLVLAVIAVLILHSPQRAPSPMSRCNVASRLRPKVRTNRRTKKKHRKLWPETPRARQTCAWEQGGGGHDERLGQALLMIRGWCCQCRGQPC